MSACNRSVEIICNNPRALKNDLRDERTMEEFKTELEKIGSIHRVTTSEDSILVVFTSSAHAEAAQEAGEVTFQGERLKLRKRVRSRSRRVSVTSASRKRAKGRRSRSASRGKGRTGYQSKRRSPSRGKGNRRERSHSHHRHRASSRHSRVERKLKSATRDKHESPEEYHERKLREFIDLNRLDDRCRRELRESSLAAQQDVMEQGFYIPPKRGRNPSQVVGGRLRISRRARVGGFEAQPPEFRSTSPHRDRQSSSSSSSSRSAQGSARTAASRSASASTRQSSPDGRNVRLRVSNIPELPGDRAKYLADLFSPYLAMLDSATGYSKPIARSWMKGNFCILEIPNYDVAESAQRILNELPLNHSRLEVEIVDAYV